MHGWGGYGMGWGMGWGMLAMMMMWLAIPIAIGAIWYWVRGGRPSRDVAKQLLRERYARGEIDAETFETMTARVAYWDS